MSQVPHYKILFFMGSEVAEDPTTKSGYGRAAHDAKGRGDMLTDIRIRAAAALYDHGCVEHIVTTGMLQIPPPHLDTPGIIREILIKDFGLPDSAVEALPTSQTTMSAIRQIKEALGVRNIQPEECAAITSFYHTPRTREMLNEAGLYALPTLAAEAMLVALEPTTAVWVEQRLRECDLTNLVVGESRGLAALWRGEYKS